MREIKFRAWNGKEMSYTFNFLDILYEGFPDMCLDNIGAEMLPNIIFMQYTGLKDKNGKEIYEGDIIKITKGEGEFLKGGKEYITDVYFKYGAFRYRWSDGSGSVVDFKSVIIIEGYEQITQDIEIIGNIYENPELLNK